MNWNGLDQWELELTLDGGTYLYKFIIDGDWRCCSKSPQVVEGGATNNILSVDPLLLTVPFWWGLGTTAS